MKSYWFRTQQGKLAAGLPALRELLTAEEDPPTDWIIESNSLMQFMRPDLYITVLDPNNEDFKDSSLRFLDRADAVVLHGPGITVAHPPAWKGISLKLIAGKPVFSITPPGYVPQELTEFVRQRLGVLHAAGKIAS